MLALGGKSKRKCHHATEAVEKKKIEKERKEKNRKVIWQKNRRVFEHKNAK